MKRSCRTALAVCLICATPLVAQNPEMASLADTARGAADDFTRATPERLARAKHETTQAAGALSEHLHRAGDNGAAWRTYALLDRLEEQLGGDSVEADVLHQVLDRLAQPHAGLERKEFRELTASLLRYTGMLASIEESAEQDYRQRVQQLAESLEKAHQQPTPEQVRELGGHLAWLEDRGQAAGVVAAVRKYYSQPNFTFTVSQRVLDGIVEPFKNDDPVREVILNTPTYGESQITGAVRMKLLPSDAGAAIEMRLDASGTADTVSVSGPVRVYSDGQIELAASKRVLFTAAGLQVSRAEAEANNHGKTKGISVALRGLAKRIACRIAWRKLQQSKSAAEAEANWKAATRLQTQFDAQAADQLDELSAFYVANIRLPLIRRRQFPPRVDLSSTAERMLMTITQADRDQLSAPTPPPKLVGESDLAVRLHESTVNNLTGKLLAGKTVQVHELIQNIEELLGQDDPTADETPASEQIEITFDDQAPVTLQFDGGVASLTLRGTKFVANGRPYPAMNVTIRYRLEKTPEGARLVLVDEPEITPPRLADGEGRMSFIELALRRLLKNRLDRDLAREINTGGVQLPRDTFKLQELPIEQLSTDDGWLVFSARIAE